MSQSRKFLIVGTGRCGSTLLSAIIAKSGGSFGLPALEDWDRRGGALEHPCILSAYKWVQILYLQWCQQLTGTLSLVCNRLFLNEKKRGRARIPWRIT